MKFLSVVFSILLVSSLTRASDILFVIGTPSQIQSRLKVLQDQGACLELHVGTKEPKNGRDDDLNGYLDDDRGFNFISGEAIKEEFTPLFRAIRNPKVGCTKSIPLVIPLNPDLKLQEKIAEYITHSPLYLEALINTYPTPLDIHLSFPEEGDLFDVLIEKLSPIRGDRVNFYFSPY